MRGRCVLLGVLFAAGCGAPDGPVAVHPVRGHVLYDGKPAVGVQVFLIPTSAPMVPQVPSNPYGVTGPDGAFELSTFGNKDGAAEGGYQVVLIWTQPPADGEEDGEEDKLLGWYGPVHSKLTATVKAGTNALPPFRLPAVTRSPAAVEGIPGKN